MNNNEHNIKVRLNRSELAVPGSRTDFFEKAAKSNADIIFLAVSYTHLTLPTTPYV